MLAFPHNFWKTEVGGCILVVGRCDPKANEMAGPVDQSQWALDELVRVEGKAEFRWVDVQHIAKLGDLHDQSPVSD